MADGKIEFDTAINTDGVEKGIKKVQKSIGAIKGAGLTAVIGAETKALKSLVAEIDKTAKAYNTQLKAETQLETAAKNNPYLNSQSINQLKEYASQLQSISTIGDEQLLPLMAQLASAGRTQEEIQKIMSAALDVSASGAMSLEGAVKNLNKSFSGLSGELGESVPAIKELSAEELKNGKAVDVLAAQYKGMAQEVANATGSYEQMKNAQGDFNEAVGKITKPTTDLWNNFWKGWYERGIENINKLESALDAQTIGKKLTKQITQGLKDLDGDFKGQTRYVRDSLNLVTDSELVSIDNYLSKLKTLSPEQDKLLKQLESEKQRRADLLVINEELAKKKEEEKKAQEEANKEAEEKNKRDEEALKFMQENQKALDENIKRIQLEAELKGEDVDQQEILNAMMSSYIDLVTGSDLVTENNPFSKKRLEELEAYAKGLEKIGYTFEDLQKGLEDLNDYLSQAQQITTDASNLFLDSISEQTSDQLTELSKQYTDGLISYEEYCDKKKEISKNAAEEEYKIKMWEWSASLLTATANIAEGVSKAIAQGGVAGIVTGALVAASGAIQLATLTANKPRPPQFANGGYVPGSSYSGDKVHALVNSGELILNGKEQAVIKSLVGSNSGGGAVVNMPVNIENNAGVNVQAQMDKNGLRIVIDEMVNASMQEGRYTQSMQIAQSKANGVSYF